MEATRKAAAILRRGGAKAYDKALRALLIAGNVVLTRLGRLAVLPTEKT
jgi:hypothetical protein